jgi:Fur family ferric uptake transcriptional regulator
MPDDDCLALCGIKKTKQRLALLGILENAQSPLTAAQIHALYQRKDKDAWLSTTYRTLDMFTGCGIVSKLVPMDGLSAQYELNRHEHRHYAVCRGCNRRWDIESCPLEGTEIDTKKGVFHVTGHRLEVYGYCDECYSKR